MRKIDLAGKRFGRLVVIKEARRKNKIALWECQCDCGKISIVYGGNLRMGYTASCGCYAIEIRSKNSKKHGMTNSKVYRTWKHMRSRCENSNVERYPNYGGRGITICERWLTFENFFEDMGQPPTVKHTLGRKDNDGNYCPDNCRWETKLQQSQNTSRTKLDNDKVKFIRSSKLSGAEIGRMFNCTKELINQVKRREIWKYM